MRKEFVEAIQRIAVEDKQLIFMTGDLGFNVLEELRSLIGERFINAGVAEQNMVGVAAGLATEGHRVICYSITPFCIFRPLEQIKVDICLHNLDVKFVGSGAGYIYGNLGATHHAIEDIAVLSSLQHMRCYIPFCNEDCVHVTLEMMRRKGPCYLRLGTWPKPEGLVIPPYNHTRKLVSGDKVTVVAMGQVVSSVFNALEMMKIEKLADVFVVSEMPMMEITEELKESLKRTGRLIVIEEHVESGGLGENLARLMLSEKIICEWTHLHAKGYPNGLYGSQQYHYKISGIDENSVMDALKRMALGQ